MRKYVILFLSLFIGYAWCGNNLYAADGENPAPVPDSHKLTKPLTPKSGESGSIDDEQRLDDVIQNFIIPANRTPMLADREGIAPRENIEPIWKSLEQMSPAKRMNTEILLDPAPGTSRTALRMIKRIESLWNSYQFDEALALLQESGKLTDLNKMSIGFSWRSPIPTEDNSAWGTDRRIGSRDTIYATCLDIHRQTGNLFAVILQRDGSNYYWFVNYSTNGGYTWNETYGWGEPWYINTISAAVVANHLYVVFSNGTDQNNARMFRFRVSDGLHEDFSGNQYYITAFSTTAPEYIKELAIASNQDFDTGTYHRLYLLGITSTGSLRHYWDDAEAVSWTQIATGISGVDKGLDVCINEEYSTYFLFCSYIDYSDSLCIDGYTGLGGFNRLRSWAIGSYPRYSSISAYHDTITCFYEHTGSTIYCKYQVSYNGGTTWLWNVVDDTTTMSESPDVSCRDGGGTGAIWRYYSDPRQGRFTWRNYWGIWSSPEHYADHEPYYNKPSIEYIGGGRFGVVYTSWFSPFQQAAYFDRGLGNVREYLLGDVNMFNGVWPPSVVGGDATYLINFFRSSPSSIACPLYDFWASADVNGDCLVIGSDVTRLINYLRGSGSLSWCPQYIPAWKSSADLPSYEPPGWPNCAIR